MDHLSMGVSNMKKFLKNIAIFFAIVAVVDFSIGKLFHYLQANMAGGRTGAEYYICERATEDVIIMGSSRASHHYIPERISEDLGISCFNGGQDGNGIILQYGRWKMMSKRYTPKLVIYDVTPDFDLFENDNERYIDRLKPYCYNPEVRDYVCSLYPEEKLKLFSKLYRNNYKFLETLSDILHNGKTTGYIPLYGKIRDEVVNAPENSERHYESPDREKCIYLKSLAEEIKEKGCELVFVVSPYWKSLDYDYSAIESIAKELDVPLLNYSKCPLSYNREYFEDSVHLNDKGANVFMGMLLNDLRQLFAFCG